MAARRRVSSQIAAARGAAAVGAEVPGALDPTRRDGPADRVLLVDDRKDNLMALEAVLEPLGYELLRATSGHEALRYLLDADADVSAVVLDVQMPDMDGYETAALLKSREATRGIPVVFLTAVGLSVEHELAGYEAGGVDYVVKPFEPRVLQAKVRAAVRGSAELRALRKAARVYREAAGALAAVGRGERSSTGSARDLAEPIVAGRRVELDLEAQVSAPSSARAAIREALTDRPHELTDTAVLLASELVSNAVVHAQSATRLRLDVGPDLVRVEIEDRETRMPDTLPPEPEAEGGRGWLMVGKLADRCGWTRLPAGKSVWFELRRPAVDEP